MKKPTENQNTDLTTKEAVIILALGCVAVVIMYLFGVIR